MKLARTAALAVLVAALAAPAAPAFATTDGGPTIRVDGLTDRQEIVHGKGHSAVATCDAVTAPVELCDMRVDTKPYINGTALDSIYGDHIFSVFARDTDGRVSTVAIHFRVTLEANPNGADQLTKLTITSPKKVKHSQRAKISIKVTEKSSHNAKGTASVSIYKGKKAIGHTIKAKVSTKNGARFTLPKLKKGTYKLVFVYHGNQYLTGSTKSVKITSR